MIKHLKNNRTKDNSVRNNIQASQVVLIVLINSLNNKICDYSFVLYLLFKIAGEKL